MTPAVVDKKAKLDEAAPAASVSAQDPEEAQSNDQSGEKRQHEGRKKGRGGGRGGKQGSTSSRAYQGKNDSRDRQVWGKKELKEGEEPKEKEARLPKKKCVVLIGFRCGCLVLLFSPSRVHAPH